MRVLILEDEQAAALRLKELVAIVSPTATIAAIIERVADAIKWLETNTLPDLILSDIQLADGISFEVFQQANLQVPVIFTTAYDAYTLKAFKLNSIDYLLKPIDIDELKNAFIKYESRKLPSTTQFAELLKQITHRPEGYKSRFLVKLGERYITIPIHEVAYIRADHRIVFLHTINGQKYIIEDALDDLVKTLDPGVFFRINRTYISPLASIDKIQSHFNGRLKITLKQCGDNDIFVSRARATEFKKWLDK
jgi:two-component system response regulator LytT